MLCKRLNLGILAHVDAGKTTLTERLLYAAGVIGELGSVDAGTTQTDSLALEQQRGITIKSAVASFAIGDVTVNLIDTPGHPDFVAEVERVLSVLDGVVLVVSAVEGVQAQTPLLMRALQRLRLPTLLFVNKVDRRGADGERVLRDIGARLTPAAIALGSVTGEGERGATYKPSAPDDPSFRERLAELLAEHDDALLSAYVDGATPPWERLQAALAEQTARALVHPVLFGSALTGAGVDDLTAAIAALLPPAAGDDEGPVSASVFKVERADGGQKVAYARLFSGRIRVRDNVRFGEEEAKVTAIAVPVGGSAVPSAAVGAGQIAKLSGLGAIRIGDTIGAPGPRPATREFPPPTFEAIVAPRRAGDEGALYLALTQLAEQDPLIDVRREAGGRDLSVSLYGDVQKEVVEATLGNDFGLDVEFREITPIYVERPVAAGEALEVLHAESNPFRATIGLRVEPAPDDRGIEFRLDVDARTAPLYLYKTLESFGEHMDEYVRGALHEGLHGWRVADCVVTMTACAYSVPDGPPSRRGPLSSASDFRKLTPIVLMEALQQAGTSVCEPILHVDLEVPTRTTGAVLALLGRFGVAGETRSLQSDFATLATVLPAARLQDLRRELSHLTGGEGVLEFRFAGYQPVRGDPPSRRRTTPNPLNRPEYLMHLARRVGP